MFAFCYQAVYSPFLSSAVIIAALSTNLPYTLLKLSFSFVTEIPYKKQQQKENILPREAKMRKTFNTEAS